MESGWQDVIGGWTTGQTLIWLRWPISQLGAMLHILGYIQEIKIRKKQQIVKNIFSRVEFSRFPVRKQMLHTVPHHSQLRKERRIPVAWRWCFSYSVNPRYDFGWWMARLAGPCSGWVEQVVSLWEWSTLLITSRGNVNNQKNYRKQEEILLVWKDRVHGREHGKNRQQIRTEYFSNAWWRDGIT
jgi:hypothetical protein